MQAAGAIGGIASSVNAGPSQEVFSFCMGGTSGNLVAAGCKSQVFF